REIFDVDPKAPTLDEIPTSRIVGCLLAGLALVVGVWYAAFGVSLLMNLPLATHRWIVASGDQDFWLGVAFFRRTGAAPAGAPLRPGVGPAPGDLHLSRRRPNVREPVRTAAPLAAPDERRDGRGLPARIRGAHRRRAHAVAGHRFPGGVRAVWGALGHRSTAATSSGA